MTESSSIRVRVPGKAVLAGEYAVLAGIPAIVVAVRRYLECVATPSAYMEIEGIGFRWREGQAETKALRFVRIAAQTARRYLEGKGERPAPLRLVLSDNLRAPTEQKLGLGGSACASVAAAAAVLAAAGAELDRQLVFKLAAIAHGAAQERPGSAIDVAAATYGGTLWTRRFDVHPFLPLIEGPSRAFADLVDRVPAPETEMLGEPQGFMLVFSGQSASTPRLVGVVERYRERDPKGFGAFMARSAEATDRLRRALVSNEIDRAMAALEDAGALLARLGVDAGAPIVTERHRQVAAQARELGAAAKVSGAGGGDCSIVIGPEEPVARLREELEGAGMVVLAPGVEQGGVQVER